MDESYEEMERKRIRRNRAIENAVLFLMGLFAMFLWLNLG